MNEHPSYEPLPKALIAQAASADIPAYLMARGEQLIPASRGYRVAAHDSLFITGHMFKWNSRQIQGNAIHFLKAYYGMGFREAVFELVGSGVEKKTDLPPAEPPKPFDFAQIELAPSMERVIAYLTKTRGLSRGLVVQLMDERRLFQEAGTNNAISPIYDGGAIVGAEVVGTMPDKRFKGIKTGSKYGCGYNVVLYRGRMPP